MLARSAFREAQSVLYPHDSITAEIEIGGANDISGLMVSSDEYMDYFERSRRRFGMPDFERQMWASIVDRGLRITVLNSREISLHTAQVASGAPASLGFSSVFKLNSCNRVLPVFLDVIPGSWSISAVCYAYAHTTGYVSCMYMEPSIRLIEMKRRAAVNSSSRVMVVSKLQFLRKGTLGTAVGDLWETVEEFEGQVALVVDER